MFETEINYPPYPKDGATIIQQLQNFTELRSWLLENRDWANAIVSEAGLGREVVPAADKIVGIPALQTYLVVPVYAIHGAWKEMRMLREGWDDIVRCFEDDWDGKKAMLARLSAIHHAHRLLNKSFISHERREADDEERSNKFSDMQKDMMRKMGVPEDFLSGDVSMSAGPFGAAMGLSPQGKDEIDFDKLFHGEDEDSEDFKEN
jgi:hypothetical protein